MLGKSAAEQGSMTPATDTIYELKRKVADFSKAYKAKKIESANRDAREIEGFLLGLQTQAVLDKNQTEYLLNQLHNLVASGTA